MALLNLPVFQRKLQSQKCFTCTILILNAKPNAILETIGCVLCSTHCLRFLARSKFWLYCCYHFCLKTIKDICEHECNHGTYQQIKCAYQFAKSYSSFYMYYMSMQISLWKTVVVDFIQWYFHTNLVFDSNVLMCYNSAYVTVHIHVCTCVLYIVSMCILYMIIEL